MDDSQVLETGEEAQEEQTEETTEEQEQIEDTQVDEEKEQLRKDNEELKKKNAQLFERAKKNKNVPQIDLATKDILYIAKSDIDPLDLDDVITYSKKMGVSLQEAHTFYKPILKERAEERNTAQATQTRSPRGTSKVSPEDLLRKAETTNQLPEDNEGMTNIFLARRARLFKNDNRK